MTQPFEKLATSSLIGDAEKLLLGRILSGELKAGEWLPAERVMAEQMGISRATLHQAILQLAAKGFVRIEPRRGTVIADYRRHPSPQILEAVMNYGSVELDYPLFSDLMALRLMLETECARLACSQIYPETMAEMRQLLTDLEKPGADIADRIYQFHYKLTQASGNSVYAMIFSGFETVVRTLTRQHFIVRGNDLHEGVQLRQALLDRIAAKDEAGAAQAVRTVLTQGISVLEERYDRPAE